MPAGLIRGVLHTDPDDCGFSKPHVALDLPGPELRVTLLKNTGTRPVRVGEIILTMQIRHGFQRADAHAQTQEGRSVADVLEPGETLLVPREFAIRATYSDAEVAEFNQDGGDPLWFRLLPRQLDPYEGSNRPHVSASQEHGYYERPTAIALPAARVVLADQSRFAYGRNDTNPELHGLFGQNGPRYVLGPSVGEVDYVINGVRLRARQDTRTTIVMIGSFESGSCPFVFARYGSTFINLGQIITDRVGVSAQGRDRISVRAGFSQLEIRELEDEVSYLDSATLVVRRSGVLLRYPAQHPALARDDRRYAVLRRDDRLPLTFAYQPRTNDRDIWLEVGGYYVPLPRRAGR
jgi:hypothetical protein